MSENLGKRICSVLTEVEKLTTRPPEEMPVHPTVSFVSMLSGILLAAEYIKYAASFGSPLETFFQMDLMFPLANSFLQPVEKVKSCDCVRRRAEIDRYRAVLTERR